MESWISEVVEDEEGGKGDHVDEDDDENEGENEDEGEDEDEGVRTRPRMPLGMRMRMMMRREMIFFGFCGTVLGVLVGAYSPGPWFFHRWVFFSQFSFCLLFFGSGC